MNYKGASSPISNSIKNPLKKGSKDALKAHHKKNLERIGLKTPKSPIG